MVALMSLNHLDSNGSLIFMNNNTMTISTTELNLPYAISEIFVAVCAVIGNGLVIMVFSKNKKLRRRTNYYIISLATADLLVGLFAIPFAVLASIGLPQNFHACLFTVSILVVLCTISIFSLVAVSIDRYWAILYPMGYSRNVRTKTAIVIICICWITGTLVGFLPLFGWNAGHKSSDKCIFTDVMDDSYLVFLYVTTIIFPALLLAASYAHIYRVVVKQMQQIIIMEPGHRSKKNQTSGTMLRLLGPTKRREVEATRNLSRIVIFFILCWFPLYTINCVEAFCHDCTTDLHLINCCIILSHLNSVGNPVLYAYHLKDFRAALKRVIYCSALRNTTDQPKKSVHELIVHPTFTMNNQRRPQRSPANVLGVMNRKIEFAVPETSSRTHNIVQASCDSTKNNSRTAMLIHERCRNSLTNLDICSSVRLSDNRLSSGTANRILPTDLFNIELQLYEFEKITEHTDENQSRISEVGNCCHVDAIFLVEGES